MWELFYFIDNIGRWTKELLSKPLWVAALVALPATLYAYSTWTENQEEAKITHAGNFGNATSDCQAWIDREYNRSSKPARVLGTWEKSGQIVVEVGWVRRNSDTTMKSRLCVFDPSSRNMTSPGAFGRWRWERY